MKELRGTPFELGRDYARRSPRPAPRAPRARAPHRLGRARRIVGDRHARALESLEGPQHVYFRREFVSFEVSGPDGMTICDPQPDGRAPDRQAFTLLKLGWLADDDESSHRALPRRHVRATGPLRRERSARHLCERRGVRLRRVRRSPRRRALGRGAHPDGLAAVPWAPHSR